MFVSNPVRALACKRLSNRCKAAQNALLTSQARAESDPNTEVKGEDARA
jgi:hypothetical protein